MPLKFNLSKLLYDEFMQQMVQKTQNIQTTQHLNKPLKAQNNNQDFQIYRSYSEFEEDFANNISDNEIIRCKV